MTAKDSKRRPKKPHPDFPLYPHPGGQWVKKVKGRNIYCGGWADHEAALRYWLKVKDQILAGYHPSDLAEALTVDDLVNVFLDSKSARMETGRLAAATFENYFKACGHLIEHFGKARLVETLTPRDFTSLRRSFPETWGPRTAKNRITDIAAVFNWAFKHDYIEKPVKTGENFGISAKELRIDRRSKPKKLFSAKEVISLVDVAKNPQIKAMILLGINGGFGNKECATLLLSDINGAWLDVYRKKTGEDRRVWLWQETRDAISLAIKSRRDALPGFEDRLFLTFQGRAWVGEDRTRRDAVGDQFGKLKRAIGCHRDRVGFYSLRHTFQTVAEEKKNDPPAIRRIMGHIDDSVQGAYRESISDGRIKAVCSAVRNWYLKGAGQ